MYDVCSPSTGAAHLTTVPGTCTTHDMYMYITCTTCSMYVPVPRIPEQSQDSHNHGCEEKAATTFLASNFFTPNPIKSSTVTYIKSSFDVMPSATSLS